MKDIREYNEEGILIHEIAVEGTVESWFNNKGQLIHKKYANGIELKFENGKEIYSKDIDGKEYFAKYNREGNLCYEKFYNGKEHFIEYDNYGNVILDKDTDGHEIKRINYSGGYKIITTYNDEVVETEKYTKEGLCIYSKNKSGYKSSKELDDNGQVLKSVSKTNNEEITELYQNGIKTVINKSLDGKTKIQKYDQRNNMIYEQLPDGRISIWKYDKNNNITYEQLPDGRTFIWEYDKNGNIVYEKDYNNTERWFDHSKTLLSIKYEGMEKEDLYKDDEYIILNDDDKDFINLQDDDDLDADFFKI